MYQFSASPSLSDTLLQKESGLHHAAEWRSPASPLLPITSIFLFYSHFLKIKISSGDTRSGTSASLTEVGLLCPEGWSLIGSKCLKPFPVEQSWSQALATCSRWENFTGQYGKCFKVDEFFRCLSAMFIAVFCG